MRTTLSLDDDLVRHAKAMAELQRRTLGEVISDYIRAGMKADTPAGRVRNGIELLPKTGKPLTLEMVNAMRDDDE